MKLELKWRLGEASESKDSLRQTKTAEAMETATAEKGRGKLYLCFCASWLLLFCSKVGLF